MIFLTIYLKKQEKKVKLDHFQILKKGKSFTISNRNLNKKVLILFNA